jgi:hypothetical protein
MMDHMKMFPVANTQIYSFMESRYIAYYLGFDGLEQEDPLYGI